LADAAAGSAVSAGAAAAGDAAGGEAGGWAGDAAASGGAACFNSGGGWPPIQAINSRPGSSMRSSQSIIPASGRSGVSPPLKTFSTTALARKQCFPSPSVALSRIGVSTGRALPVRRKNLREASSACRERTSSSVAQGSFSCSAMPVFFALPPGFGGSAGPFALTGTLSTLCARPAKKASRPRPPTAASRRRLARTRCACGATRAIP
jgi:hypothetical protein